ncbi:hypothetical protein [Pseudomonas sp. Gutcm_11s]|uniref:hypothetical protein n=1 Tax=Pseudomonas sp. Gutcm_11s TaxID=3026088 RepID=UPI0023609A56|nr:hypothetical protein [Pseudomonas sp. Gutcm_11s]MDD0845208.1 hypothetical protein [Pseudomonas sp. Gutcm_11s]
MRQLAILLLCAGLAGCSGKGSAPSTCEVLSPPEIILPTTQDDQRVEAQSSGDPTVSGSEQQNCP